MNKELNRPLIGVSGSAQRLQTPALVIDLDKFEKNIQTMTDHCEKSGISLRPHSKTHKSIEIAERQIAAGAVGICCAKLGEAEVMGGGGIENILITSPVVLGAGIERLMRLNADVSELMVVADNLSNISTLSEAAAASGRKTSCAAGSRSRPAQNRHQTRRGGTQAGPGDCRKRQPRIYGVAMLCRTSHACRGF